MDMDIDYSFIGTAHWPVITRKFSFVITSFHKIMNPRDYVLIFRKMASFCLLTKARNDT
jgi:hypothetical protein